jgi:hypothetical protein
MEQMIRPATLLWKWEIPDNFPNKMIGVYDRENSPDRFEFQRGKKIENLISLPKFLFSVSSARLKNFDVLPNNAGSPLISLRVAEILSGICPESVQFFDAEVQTKDDLLKDFRLLNIIELVSSLNLEKSLYSLLPGSKFIRSFQRRVHKTEGIASNLLAREELCKSHIIIANDVYDAFLLNKIKSVYFSPCEIG